MTSAPSQTSVHGETIATENERAAPPISNSSSLAPKQKIKAGPEPLLLSRKEVDVLYDILDVTRKALDLLKVEYIVTGGSLLGAIRQHSILFCDDDIDIAIIDPAAHHPNHRQEGSTPSVYESIVVPQLQSALDRVVEEEHASSTTTSKEKPKYVYQIKPWEGGDRIRSKRFNNVFLDLFVLRKYPTQESFLEVIGRKKNGQAQPSSYTDGILDTIQKSCSSQQHTSPSSSVFPFWQFSTRKAIELWPKEIYLAAPTSTTTATTDPESPDTEARRDELFPLQRNLKFGPLTGVCGPNTPVTLLKRAFGKDCFEVYYRSISHSQPQPQQQTPTPQHTETVQNGSGNGKSLPPKVAPGGTWEASPKVPLEEEHYLPMQPLARKRRRPTLHCRATLWKYLQEQTLVEASLQTELMRAREVSPNEEVLESSQGIQENDSRGTACGSVVRPRRTVYMDGVFDLFHIGHLEAIRQCAALGDRVILGVTGDADAEGYKRRPIVPQDERTAIVGALQEVHAVVCPCPLVVTQEFMEWHGIDLVVHGFANDADATKQEEFFAIPMALGKFQRIGYYKGLSTTDRIQRIREEQRKDKNGINEGENATPNDTSKHHVTTVAKPQWFGATLAAATNHSPTIPTDPFPLTLRMAIESHIDKARIRRKEALHAIKIATGVATYDSILKEFQIQQERLEHCHSPPLLQDSDVEVEQKAHRKLVESLLVSTGFSPDTDLSRLHEEPLVDGKTAKDRLLHALTENYGPFQESFDDFVRTICVPRMVQALEGGGGGGGGGGGSRSPCTKVYYQAFPCLRIVQPGDFSIGPHSDVAYGHHPCSVNGYVSLTEPDHGGQGGCGDGHSAPASALFLESRPGAEDWHSLFGRHHGTTEGSSSRVRLFAGALNLHWTTENLTSDTRVTFDFRMIDGAVFDRLRDGGHLEGGQKDVFRETPGYYHVCHKHHDGTWIRQAGELERPDFRVGFPWTVKNWDKFWKKTANQQTKTTKPNLSSGV